MLLLDDAKLASLAANPKVTEAFPFLKVLRDADRRLRASGGCGGCGAKKKGVGLDRAKALYTVRRTIVGLSTEQKRKLLGLLGAKEARLFYKDAKQRTLRHTITLKS